MDRDRNLGKAHAFGDRLSYRPRVVSEDLTRGRVDGLGCPFPDSHPACQARAEESAMTGSGPTRRDVGARQGLYRRCIFTWFIGKASALAIPVQIDNL